jgi:hypothetical protein
MTARLVVELEDAEDQALVVAALRTAAENRTSVARLGAAETRESRRAGADYRAQALPITRTREEAARLNLAAAAIEAATAEVLAITSSGPGTLADLAQPVTPVSDDDAAAIALAGLPTEDTPAEGIGAETARRVRKARASGRLTAVGSPPAPVEVPEPTEAELRAELGLEP